MAIGPGNKITTTGLINKQPMIPEVPVMPKQQPTQAQVTPPVAESQDGPLTTKYPGVKNLSDEDIEKLEEKMEGLSEEWKDKIMKSVFDGEVVRPDLERVINRIDQLISEEQEKKDG